MRKKKKILLLFLVSISLIFFLIPLVNIYWFNTPSPLNPIKPIKYGIVFGASIKPKGILSPVLRSRMDDGILLYKQKKVQKLILSGSVYKQMPPGEPLAMKWYALKQGVLSQDIILDEGGERTYLTILFAKKLSRLTPEASFVFISSPYHMMRIRYLSYLLEIKNTYFFFTPKSIPVLSKEVLREILAFWFYFTSKIFFYLR